MEFSTYQNSYNRTKSFLIKNHVTCIEKMTMRELASNPNFVKWEESPEKICTKLLIRAKKLLKVRRYEEFQP